MQRNLNAGFAQVQILLVARQKFVMMRAFDSGPG